MNKIYKSAREDMKAGRPFAFRFNRYDDGSCAVMSGEGKFLQLFASFHAANMEVEKQHNKALRIYWRKNAINS